MAAGSPAPPDRSEITRRLQQALGDGYVVERELGAGGFAIVFLVRDVSLKRKLAVKVLSPELITSKTVLERFQREAETVAQLAHPNIVPLHFIGQKDDLLYLAMGYIDGGSLGDRIPEKGAPFMPIDAARRAIAEVASALGHAHKRGVIHRDIKPHNVLIDSESGRCLVTDFGIARSAEGGSLTATGMVMGTPAYLAPEQVTGEPSDHRADIYALGVMAYEMLTGRQPFEATTPTAVMMKRLAGPPQPVSKIRPDVPRDLQDVIDGMLAADPTERFQSADEVVRALGGTSASGGHATAEFVVKARRKKQRQLVVIAGVTAAAAVIGVFAMNALRKDEPSVAGPAPMDSGMVRIPEGSYTIGFDSGPANARPSHAQHLQAFGIDAHEVTVGEYKAFASATNTPVPWTVANPNPSLPVTRVLWSEAMNYCVWRHPHGGQLPSEEEWEAAARGLEHRRYPWGSTPDLAAANTRSAQRTGPAPVGTFPRGATPDGIHDLIGNVWEWTRSPLQSYPGAPAMPDSMQNLRVIRGGAFNTADGIATTWLRGYNLPSPPRDEVEFTGFRCVMPVR